jgi:hypothetical protein
MSSPSPAPNLFTHAPSELSQDAFLAWLLAWADAEYAEATPALHRTGCLFVEALLAKAGRAVPNYHSVSVKTQHPASHGGKDGAIDVLVVLDNTWAILIEDKVRAGVHGSQLEDYRASAEREYGPDHVAALYLKTHDQASYAAPREAGYTPFLRGDLLHVLDEGVAAFGVQNDIYADFHAHLQGIEKRVAAFAHRSVGAWPKGSEGRDLWTGFFRAVQEQRPEARWGYVNNASGGFMALWWNGDEHEGCSTYLQLEEDALSLRIVVPEKTDRRALRLAWHERILAAADGVELAVRRPNRFGHGRTMRVAEVETYLRADDHGRLDLEGTLEELEKAEDVLRQARRRTAS